MFDVVVKDAALAYGEKVVFNHLNLTLDGGKWTCLLGGSGVGKTSLLRLIAGLSTGKGLTTSGSVVCQDGFSLKGRIAWMAQQDLLLPWFSVIDNITLGKRLRGSTFNLSHLFKPSIKSSIKPWTKKDGIRSWLPSHKKVPPEEIERAKHILEQVGLVDKSGELPQNLSGGQRQRVALARTLMENRPLVLMDEPFGALDAITRLNLQDLACELLKNRTVLLITHDPLEALRLGHHIYHLQGQPATLTEAIMPPGAPPRSLENSELMSLQGELLERLRNEGKHS
ncbi:ABC transporter ATP-binding protein [Endozoicomonas numazuensis]|uniref:ABC transporter ATP-binding protein n=1 Tax=Endozoicomonas numazuensis TaxID=1137799 RepID=A0A081NDG6_9GAMM|nr:ABC transporter ATP-binding protein [Endozoicomonas numazuensis]KEQ16489.1 ABC transporter ATP-binding protein [Endozoicomonas numazuensis]